MAALPEGSTLREAGFKVGSKFKVIYKLSDGYPYDLGDIVELDREDQLDTTLPYLKLQREKDGWGYYCIETRCLEPIDEAAPTTTSPPDGDCIEASVSFDDDPSSGNNETKEEEGTKFMDNTKYYRVIKDTPALSEGAILKYYSTTEYAAIGDLWNTPAADAVCKVAITSTLRLRSALVENAPEFYERVYETSLLGKVKFVTKEKAIELHDAMFKVKK